MNSPSKILLALEVARAAIEYGQAVILNMPLRFTAPKGDGHPVIVFPGLGAADGSTFFVRSFLGDIGYTVYPWGLGRNYGPRGGLDQMILDLNKRVSSVSDIHDGAKVSLIGWSLGGIYAREVAKHSPNLIRQVITLGTPFKGQAAGTNATKLYELLSKDKSHYDPAIMESVAKCPDVPFTSIYSKTDGVVSWQCSIEDESTQAENIEVPGASHLGLGHNPISMHIIANRLSQSESSWQHYKRD